MNNATFAKKTRNAKFICIRSARYTFFLGCDIGKKKNKGLRPKEEPINDSYFVDNVRKETKNKWQVRVGVRGPSLRCFPVDIGVELRHAGELKQIPKIEVGLELKQISGGMEYRSRKLNPPFKAIKKFVWMSEVLDAFHSNNFENPILKSLPFGNYHICVRLRIEKGPTFHFKNIPIAVLPKEK